MKGVDQKTMLRIWEALLVLERATDNELSKRAGISQGTVSGWRSGRSTGSVRLSTLGQIERGLGYHVELKEGGKFDLRKTDAPPPVVRESRSPYRPSELNGAFKNVSPTEIPALIVILKAVQGMGPEHLNRLAAEIRHATPERQAQVFGIAIALLRLDQAATDNVEFQVERMHTPQGDPLRAHR